MSTALRLSLATILLTTLTAGLAFGADKKAEGDMRWGLNYCKKAFNELDRAKGRELSPQGINDLLSDIKPHYDKFLDYMKKAKEKDQGVVDSTTIFDRKTNTTFAQYYQQCLQLEGRMQALREQIDAKNAKRAEKKEAEATAQQAEETHRLALEAAKSAIYGNCAGFKGWAGSSGIDDRIKDYEADKQKAVVLLPSIVDESYTTELKMTPEDPGTKTTKTFGQWFAFCDKMMPEHASVVRKNEAEADAKTEQWAAKQKAMNDKIRKEQEEQFKALVASSKGDRKRILKSKGFLPRWPRSGDLNTAPVWKWEIAITHQPTRCESFQFKGNKLITTSSALGVCP